MVRLPITNIQRFCTQDGDGIRTTVFLKGCMLRCAWCHNPETQAVSAQVSYNPHLCVGCRACEQVCTKGAHSFEDNTHTIRRDICGDCTDCVSVCAYSALEKIGEMKSILEIVQTVQKDEVFYGAKGGVTISGGEPMMHGEKTMALLREMKKANIHLCLETSGYFSAEFVDELSGLVDCFLWDIKDTLSDRHKTYTGVYNERILENIRKIDALGGKTVLRCIMVNGVNTDTLHLDGIANLYKTLRHCLRVEIFSYHDYGGGKYTSLGKEYSAKKEWITPVAELKKIRKYLQSLSVKCKITGI